MSRLINPRNDNVVDLSALDRTGRKQLVEQLFARHAPAVRLFLRGRAVPHEQIDDIVQELFTRLMGTEKLEEQISESIRNVRSYLLTMTNNLVVDRQRRRRVRNAHAESQRALEAVPMEERTPERVVAAKLELEAIMAVLMDLPLHWRVAFVLQRFRNMSYKDIAAHMGVTVRQVRYYLRRAMRRIHKARRKIEAAGEKSC